MTETEQLADIIALSIHAATEPLLLKIAVLEARPVGYGTKDAWDALQDTISDLRTRLMTVEGRAPVPGPQGPQGERGEPGTIGLKGMDGAVGPAGERGLPGEVGQRGPMGEKGEPGLNGKDGAIGLTGEKGANGRDGLPGVPGRWGDKGDPGVAGKDGRDGLNGTDGSDGLNGKDGTNGLNGKDGADGLNGKDGLGFDDLVFDEHKGWLLKSADREISVPIPFDAGVWTSGRLYPKGAGTTVNGAFWIAREATTTRPGDGTPASAKAWRLAVKGGKDGKPGPQGPAGKDWAP